LSIDREAARAVRRSDTNAYDVEVLDLATKKILSSIKGLSGVVNTANISPDGRKVVTAERRGIVGLWDAETGKQIRLLRGHEDQIQDARFSPDGSMIASGARDSTARTWDTETGAQIAVHQQKGGHYVDTVSFSPDGRWVLSAGNGWAEVWNARSGKVHQSIFVGPDNAGAFDTSARFSRDGKSIVVSDPDGVPTKTIPIEPPLDAGATLGEQH
jgi:WD40 repeat protein